MSDYVKATGVPGVVTLGGRDYRVPRFGPRLTGELDAWLRRHVPDPRIQARKDMDGQPPETRNHIWDRALEEAALWPPTVLDERGIAILLTKFEGQCELLYHVLRKEDPAITRKAAEAIADECDLADMKTLFEALVPEAVAVPKGETAATTEGVTTTPPDPATDSSSG